MTFLPLSTGWLTLHPYIPIVQTNTDPEGWQYRSDWSEEGAPGARDEQWAEG